MDALNNSALPIEDDRQSVEIRVRGTVQGVGFRPTVWRLARSGGLVGEVRNDASGVLITATGSRDALSCFLYCLKAEAPPLSRIEAIETRTLTTPLDYRDFQITESANGETRTRVTADAAVCSACRAETLAPDERRFRYPFTNCTHCGPRFSIVNAVPYDRANTSMARFAMCADCAGEYADPVDRRFHAQPIACPRCGPKVWIEHLGDEPVAPSEDVTDAVEIGVAAISAGEIVAIRGVGGFHLACDATNADAVERLRSRKRRYGKPFALMARDMDVVRRYCHVDDREQQVLESPEAPVVLLATNGRETLPDAVAPRLKALGFMLPYSPLHLLVMREMDRPLVMTSGNTSDEPQVIDNQDARSKLAGIADIALLHNRDIVNRIDDSVVRVMAGEARLVRRARGYAPSPITLPPGFETAPDLLAYGGELKATFCLLKDGAAIVSQHQGDLEDASTFDDYLKNLELYAALYDHQPQLLVADRHPEYLSTKLAKEIAIEHQLPIEEVQHHHAHVASCLADNDNPLDAPPVLGVVLDGLGFGDDGAIWGGEFLLADYRRYERVGTFKPVAMPGGVQAIREPWRNTYAHLMAAMDWATFEEQCAELALYRYLREKPRQTLDRMLERRLNVPLASSCGRLFDAVSAALGMCPDRSLFEGQGAIELEMAVDEESLYAKDDALSYPFTIANSPANPLPYVEPAAMWQVLITDLKSNTPVPIMAARFHKGLAKAITEMVAKLAEGRRVSGRTIDTVALSGGCFQNKVLLEQVSRRIASNGFKVLSQSKVPPNDGGLALGQAAVAASRNINI